MLVCILSPADRKGVILGEVNYCLPTFSSDNRRISWNWGFTFGTRDREQKVRVSSNQQCKLLWLNIGSPAPALTHLGVRKCFPERSAQTPEESGEFVHAGGGGYVDAADDLDELRKTVERIQWESHAEEDHTHHTHT